MVELDCFRRRSRNPLYDKPARERHIVSVAASLISVVLLIISFTLPTWATATISNCNCWFGLTRVRCITPKPEGTCGEMMSEWSVHFFLFLLLHLFPPFLPFHLYPSINILQSLPLHLDSSFSSPLFHSSDWILPDLPRDPHILCPQHQCTYHDLFVDSSFHQCRLPSREAGVSPSLLSVQHCVMWVLSGVMHRNQCNSLGRADRNVLMKRFEIKSLSNGDASTVKMLPNIQLRGCVALTLLCSSTLKKKSI